MKDIFIFGSNREGKHGKGAALDAWQKHGAIYGQAMGLQGNSYAIITKELRKNEPKVKLQEIKEQIGIFRLFAKNNQDMRFNVTAIGCGLAGFGVNQIAPMFGWAYGFNTPNVRLPAEFIAWLNWYNDPYTNNNGAY